MKLKKIQDKKAISEMVSYVLLVVIAIALAILVYAWIKTQLPKEDDECQDKTSIILKKIACDESVNLVNITYQNKGFFDVDGINIKISNKTGEIPVYDLMTGIKPWNNHSIVINEVRNFTYFRNPLRPGNEYTLTYDYSKFNQIARIQLTPFIAKQKGVQETTQVICVNSIIIQDAECK